MLPMTTYYGMEANRNAIRANEIEMQKTVEALSPIADRLHELGFAIVLVGPNSMGGLDNNTVEAALEAKVDGIVNELLSAK